MTGEYEITEFEPTEFPRPSDGSDREVRIIDYEGEECYFYPWTGAVRSKKNGRIVGNLGGNRLDDPDTARAMGRRSGEVRMEALIEGLMRGGEVFSLSDKGDPRGVLAAVVKRQVEVALNGGDKQSTVAAKWLFSLLEEEEKRMSNRTSIENASMEITLSPEAMEKFLDVFGRE